MGENEQPKLVSAVPGTVSSTTSPNKIRFRQRPLIRNLLASVALLSIAVTLSTILPTPWFLFQKYSSLNIPLRVAQSDPAEEWKDNIWPLRPQTPWDISTNYAYTRKLEYDVKEGTWLRLDVHPTSGDIVFDMLGDIYCLPGKHAMSSNDETVKALAVLTGIPHDSDPHFSPTGDRLVFRSDAELGVENIWVIEWKGCEKMDVRSTLQDSSKYHLKLWQENELEESLFSETLQGVEESSTKARRLMGEGRLNAQRVTNETYRWVTDARFHPSGTKVIATKWYTSGRSLGAGEGWEYDVPTVKDLQMRKVKPIEAGSGTRLVARSLPLGWTSDSYGDQQIGPEQLIWSGNDSVIFAKNVIDSSKFEYSKDVHSGIYAIMQRNLTTSSTEILVSSFPGGASRPELSRDSRTLAFVRRVRDKQALVLKDLQTGSIHNVWYGLSYDLSGVSAPMGTYPSFAFAPDDNAVIIWADGQIYSVPLSVNRHGEKIASPANPRRIPFTAHIIKQLAETRRGGVDLIGFETRDAQEIRAFKNLRVNDQGGKVVFQAAGVTYWQGVGEETGGKVPVSDQDATYYSPTFVPGQSDLVLHARWSDSYYTTFELANTETNTVHEISVPFGRYISPVLCECKGRKRTIAFIKTGGSYLSGDVLATGGAGLYLGEITLPDENVADTLKISIQNLRHVPSEIDPEDDLLNMRFVITNRKLLVHQSTSAFVVDLEGKPHISGKPPHQTIASGKMSTELAVSQKLTKKGVITAKNVAFVDFYHVYFAPGHLIKKGESLWSRPANATRGIVRLSLDGGHDVTFSHDGKRLFWVLGPYLHSLEVARLRKCSTEIKNDKTTFGISCVKTLLDIQKIRVEHTTDISRLKQQASKAARVHKPWTTHEEGNSDVVAIYNATLLTMETDDQTTDLIASGVLVSRGGLIEFVGPLEGYTIPSGATVIDAHGGFVAPGFIDVHAHWDGFTDRYPSKSWELETFLAYGVTTLHNPSADTVSTFSERSRVESGKMIGPRIFTTGTIIYGAAAPDHQDIVDMDEAKSALVRLKAEGGPASISYKNYNLPSRASRQRLLTVAKNLSMLCVPEGGMNYDWDLTYIIDGMTTIEHALPVPKLFDDVLTLYAKSGTGSTPTHIVNYGGAWGEQLVWATEDVPNDPKLRRFTRHDILEGLAESTSRPFDSYALYNTSISVANMVGKGLLANIGAHGEPPIGLNYHAEMGFTGAGGLSNYEVIRAATSSGARTLGMFPSLGSLSPGKLADFLVYYPGVNLLEGEVSEKTRQIRLVARGGRIWEANTMEEVWPQKGKKQVMPIINAD